MRVGYSRRAGDEIQDALPEVVARAVDVCAVLEQAPDERERAGQLMAAAVRVEKVQDVDGDYGVQARHIPVEVRLRRARQNEYEGTAR